MDISIVLPVHNESESLKTFYPELKSVLNKIKKSYEMVFVDDGSTDSSFKFLQELAKKDKTVRIIKLRGNYGQSIALAAGIDNTKGNVIITMDSDGQHNPADIPRMLDALKDNDVVVGRRIWQHRPFAKKISSWFANFLVRSVTKVKLQDSIGGFKAFRREVSENITLYGNLHRYLPVLASWKGFKVTDVPVVIRQRKKGKSHYGISRLFSGMLDLLTVKFFVSYSQRPSHLFGTAGFLTFLLGFIISAWLTIEKLFFGFSIGSRLPLFILGILLLTLGIFFSFFGLLADMISYDSIASGKRKVYIVEKILN